MSAVQAQAAMRGAPGGAPRSLADRVDTERVRILYAAVPFSILLHLLCAALLAYALRNVVQGILLAGWFAAMLLVCAGRWVLCQNHRDAVNLPGDARGWEIRSATGAFLIALVWSALALFLFPAHSVPHQMLLIFVVASVAIGGAGAVQASKMTFIALVGTILLALFIRLILTGEEIYTYAAALIALSFPASASMFLRLHSAIQESLLTRFEKEDIAEELRRIEAQMQQAFLEQKVILDTAPVGIAFVRDRRILSCNRRMEEMFGFAPGELSGRSTRSFYQSDSVWMETKQRIDANLETNGLHDEELEFFGRDGTPIWCLFAGRPLDKNDATRGNVWIFADVTKRREAEQSLKRANTVIIDAIESIPDAFAIFEREDRLVLCNRKYLEGVGEGVTFDQAKGMTFQELVRNAIARGEPVPAEYGGDVEAWVAERLRRHHQPDGDFIQEFVGGHWIQARDRRTSEGGIVSVRTDITDLRRNQERAEFLANHDPLTELPNRRLLEDRMHQALSMARRNQSMVALMVLDLDRFKHINDNHGHRLGDEVLRESAKRLKSCVRAVDTVSRMGGDEFVIVLSELHQAQDAALVAQKIIDSLALPILIEGKSLRIECSIGIAQHTANGDDPDELLKAADVAMYRAKESGRNCYRFAEATVVGAPGGA